MPYFVIEGQDATGKTTQVEMLAKYLKKQKKEVVVFQEPDGDLPQLKKIMSLVKNKGYMLEAESQMLAFTMARVEIWQKLAKSVLVRGGYALASRNWYSTLAYQGYGAGVELGKIERLTQEMLPQEYWRPDKAVVLVLPEQVRLERQAGRDDLSGKDAFESRGNDYQRRVNEGYLKIACKHGAEVLEATGTEEEVQEKIRKILGV